TGSAQIRCGSHTQHNPTAWRSPRLSDTRSGLFPVATTPPGASSNAGRILPVVLPYRAAQKSTVRSSYPRYTGWPVASSRPMNCPGRAQSGRPALIRALDFATLFADIAAMSARLARFFVACLTDAPGRFRRRLATTPAPTTTPAVQITNTPRLNHNPAGRTNPGRPCASPVVPVASRDCRNAASGLADSDDPARCWPVQNTTHSTTSTPAATKGNSSRAH
ncbi:hypothetical protein QR98_0085630, partial [Sarcoptes scabiei]